MFTINIYLRFALIFITLVGGVILAFLFGFWYAFPISSDRDHTIGRLYFVGHCTICRFTYATDGSSRSGKTIEFDL